ncbi:MAG: hypothetical protein QOK37_3838 [Thermoanaerobaculia bacterium]|jgi:hypothetical protein|nr:hypothetical protein [Thermoanaerobaculia bacterium]
MSDDPNKAQRFDLLSNSESGLSYVREKRGGTMRVLTESELADFNDPPPCPQCAEQFGCEHFNCAGEPMLDDDAVLASAPPEWLAFAKACGISTPDLERLKLIREHEGEYRVVEDAVTDMRTLEIVLLLNGE